LVSERENEEYNNLLYQIDSFYVKVFYHKEYEGIIRHRAFSSTDELAPYLNRIKIKL
jgi:hypothetical protein